MIRKLLASAFFASQIAFAHAALAETPAFASGWTLSETGSNLHFISVKKSKVMESSTFATLGGTIDESGLARFEVALDSIDTSVDLRNVRMRFLFFETFSYPKAVVTAQLTEDLIAGLEDEGSITRNLPFKLELRGIAKDIEAEVIITLANNNRVSIASKEPVILQLADFDLMEGREKLQEAAEVDIVPATSVSFHLIFDRNDPLAEADNLIASAAVGASAALEPEGNFDREACIGRFEILSKSGNIVFAPSSAKLAAESNPFLQDVAYIIGKCPGMVVQIAGHTDNRGKSAYNQSLSQQRAQSVKDYLMSQGISPDRLTSIGYGETRPIASNRTVAGRQANRRIEFSLESFSSGS